MKHLLLCLCVPLMVAAPLAQAADDGTAAANRPVSALVQTSIIGERTIAASLQAFGTVEPGPRQLREIVAPGASEVQLEVVAGARVKRGEPLVTLVATPTSAVLYAQAKAEADYAGSALKRTQSLFKAHLATRDQLAAAEKALQNAQANLAAQQQMGGGHTAVIRAPADGVVSSVAVASGARVAANTTLLTLVEQDGLYARLGVAPEQAQAVRVGMPVTLSAVFDPRSTLQAKVSQVGGVVDPASGLVDVLASITVKTAAQFIPGAHVTAAIILNSSHALAVPRSAVLHDAQGAYLFIVKDHVARRVNVQAGIDDGTWIAVQGALHAGERVVTLGNYELIDGMAVREQAP
ncbi:MAG: efflux RND transporter periplasmic adaptor subunit [Gammaproteobacteria bacterium]|nr:efflux RND transporter periplasmic adaptor subunit [Gammaproteobacteria bacterium]